MGDVLSLIEKAEAAVEDDEREEMEQRMMQGEFTFDDFLAQLQDAAPHGPAPGRDEDDPRASASSSRGSTTWTSGSSRASRRSCSR